MAKRSSRNLRAKRNYILWLKDAKGHSEASIDKAAAAIDRYEGYVKGVPPPVFETPDCDYAARGIVSIWSRRNWAGERWPWRSISQHSL
jgi:hypothetical protein